MTRAPFRAIALAAVFACVPATASAEATKRTYGGLTIEVDDESAFPGGMVTVRLASRRPLRGIVYAILDGRRCPAFSAPTGLRALVPVPVTHPAGRATLGIEIRSSRGRQRYAVPVTIAARDYEARDVVVPDAKREAAAAPASVRDGRLLQQYLRTVTRRQEWRGPFRSPVDAAPAPTFGAARTYAGMGGVESRMDAIHGEYHRGLDYDVPPGTAVRAPAAGTVLFAGTLALTGRTVVVDHGVGLVSVFSHLADAQVREGDPVEAGRTIGTSGDSGIAAAPHLHWGVYLLGVAIDPRVTEGLS